MSDHPEELSGQDAAVLGLGADAVGPIRCFVCGSDEPILVHRCPGPAGPLPSEIGPVALPVDDGYDAVQRDRPPPVQRSAYHLQEPLPSESIRPLAPEEPPEECDVCHAAFGSDGEFRRMMVVRDSASRRPSTRSPLLMEDEWKLAVCEPCHEQFEAWLFRDLSELDTLRPPPPANEPSEEFIRTRQAKYDALDGAIIAQAIATLTCPIDSQKLERKPNPRQAPGFGDVFVCPCGYEVSE